MKILKYFWAFLFLIFASNQANAAFNQSWCTRPLGYQQYTSLSAATGLSPIPAGTIYIVVTVESAGIRWRDDGTNPTASVGMPVSSGASFSYTANFAAIKFIQQSASATIDVYYCGP
jgi:hypothetical protein